MIHIERTRLLWDEPAVRAAHPDQLRRTRRAGAAALRLRQRFRRHLRGARTHRARRGAGCSPPRLEDARRHPRLRRPGRRRARMRHRLLAARRPARARTRAEFTLALPSPRAAFGSTSRSESSRPTTPDGSRFRRAAAQARMAMRRKRRRGASLHCARGPFQTWLQKSRADLALLTTELPTGPYPYAGIPWFSTPFGRDGIITALRDAVARPVARARRAAVPGREPGARRRRRSTTRRRARSCTRRARASWPRSAKCPSRAITAASTRRRCSSCWPAPTRGEPATSRSSTRLWPALDAAMAWIDGVGRFEPRRLRRLCPREPPSASSIRDGRTAPIRSSTPTARWRRRRSRWSRCRATSMPRGGVWPGSPNAAATLDRAQDMAAAGEGAARRGREAVLAIRTWASTRSPSTARDDRAACARPIPGTCSTPACPRRTRASRVIEQLLSAAFNNGWGLRTLASDQPRFNPMSYHNGSVWPHDTAMCAAGMAAYGHRDAAAHAAQRVVRRRDPFRDAAAGAVLRVRRAAPASLRSAIRSPACRRRGRRARRS